MRLPLTTAGRAPFLDRPQYSAGGGFRAIFYTTISGHSHQDPGHFREENGRGENMTHLAQTVRVWPISCRYKAANSKIDWRAHDYDEY